MSAQLTQRSERKLFARINPEAYEVNFEEIYECLGEGYILQQSSNLTIVQHGVRL